MQWRDSENLIRIGRDFSDANSQPRGWSHTCCIWHAMENCNQTSRACSTARQALGRRNTKNSSPTPKFERNLYYLGILFLWAISGQERLLSTNAYPVRCFFFFQSSRLVIINFVFLDINIFNCTSSYAKIMSSYTFMTTNKRFPNLILMNYLSKSYCSEIIAKFLDYQQ